MYNAKRKIQKNIPMAAGLGGGSADAAAVLLALNEIYDTEITSEKLEEIADCFIVLMNIAMFSGFDGSQLFEAIDKKLNEVSERIGA